MATCQSHDNRLAEPWRIGFGLNIRQVEFGEECGGLRKRDQTLPLATKKRV